MIVSLLSLLMESLSALFACYVREIHTKLLVDIGGIIYIFQIIYIFFFILRFCHSCIVTWLSEGKTCPDDNTTISINEIFPDAIAKREIQQLKVR